MTSVPPETPQGGTPPGDDTAAFQRFYLDDQAAKASRHGLLYRLLVGWWRQD